MIVIIMAAGGGHYAAATAGNVQLHSALSKVPLAEVSRVGSALPSSAAMATSTAALLPESLASAAKSAFL